MDADIDWCLSCNRRVDNGILYCSQACRPTRSAPQSAPEPTASTHHSWRAAHDERAAIHAWAANIPAGPPPPPDEPPTPSGSPHPPSLLRPPRRAVPPSLSMTTPAAAAPHSTSLPLPAAPRRPSSSVSLALSGYASAGQTSRCTPATESSLAPATPPQHAHAHPTPLLASSRRPSVIGGIFRGWAAPPSSPQLPALSSSRGSHAPTPPYALPQKRPPPGLYDPPTPPRETHSFPARGRRASRAAA